MGKKISVSEFISEKKLEKIEKIIYKSSSVEEAYDKIENVLIGDFKAKDLGTNRLVFVSNKNNKYIFKVAGDSHGIEANYREFYNGDLDNKRMTKSYSISKNGVFLVQERVKPFDSAMMAKHKKEVRKILKKLESKILLVDCKLSNFKNFGMRKNGDIVLLDHGDTVPLTMYENGKIVNIVEESNVSLNCKEYKKGTISSKNPKPCGGKLRYDKNYEYFVCDKCKAKSTIHNAYREFYGYSRLNTNDEKMLSNYQEGFDPDEYAKEVQKTLEQYAQDKMNENEKEKNDMEKTINGVKCQQIKGYWIPIKTNNAVANVKLQSVKRGSMKPSEYLEYLGLNPDDYKMGKNDHEISKKNKEEITSKFKKIVKNILKMVDNYETVEFSGNENPLRNGVFAPIPINHIVNVCKNIDMDIRKNIFDINKYIKNENQIKYAFFDKEYFYVCDSSFDVAEKQEDIDNVINENAKIETSVLSETDVDTVTDEVADNIVVEYKNNYEGECVPLSEYSDDVYALSEDTGSINSNSYILSVDEYHLCNGIYIPNELYDEDVHKMLININGVMSGMTTERCIDNEIVTRSLAMMSPIYPVFTYNQIYELMMRYDLSHLIEDGKLNSDGIEYVLSLDSIIGIEDMESHRCYHLTLKSSDESVVLDEYEDDEDYIEEYDESDEEVEIVSSIKPADCIETSPVDESMSYIDRFMYTMKNLNMHSSVKNIIGLLNKDFLIERYGENIANYIELFALSVTKIEDDKRFENNVPAQEFEISNTSELYKIDSLKDLDMIAVKDTDNLRDNSEYTYTDDDREEYANLLIADELLKVSYSFAEACTTAQLLSDITDDFIDVCNSIEIPNKYSRTITEDSFDEFLDMVEEFLDGEDDSDYMADEDDISYDVQKAIAELDTVTLNMDDVKDKKFVFKVDTGDKIVNATINIYDILLQMSDKIAVSMESDE